MRRTYRGVTSGFRRRISAGMVSGQPDFLQWWILTSRRYFVSAGPYHRLSLDEIPVEITQRQSTPHPVRHDVPHVQDNRRLGRRVMVRTRTTARDWQWLDKMMAEDAPTKRPAQKIRRMPEGYGRRRRAGRASRGGRGCVEGSDMAPTQQTQGGANTSQAVDAAGRAHRLTSYPPL
ncbi:hypothetical protein PIB30_019963 [Stylosanthes scabra]|uniref:Uncharacterized protein n=1 Tax=Stylosanthes scabra TaxID=79078 RepID=A0ABU6X9U4_9FABA|nr:hypothetical protein [Stylosanthes scabra]